MKKGALALLFLAGYVAACASEESTTGGAPVVAAGRPGPGASVPGRGPLGSVAEAKAAWERDIAGTAAAGGTAGDRVFFALDRTDLSAEAQTTLRRQAEWLRRYGNVTVTLEGHADERGTREYNLALGDRRATAARNFLIASGVPAERIRTVTYGKERPAIVGSIETAYAQNRRAVTTID